jgi:hypothetical protein
MRIPGSILTRVRGPAAVVALAACASPAPAPEPAAPPPTSIAVVAPAPIDPVAYSSADEAARLSRVDDEAVAAVDARETRIGAIAARRHRTQVRYDTGGLTSDDPLEEALLRQQGIGGGSISGGNYPGGRGRFPVCAGCGRG